MHILEVLAGYHKRKKLSPKEVAKILRRDLSPYDLKILRKRDWRLGKVGKPQGKISPGVKMWSKIFPHYHKYLEGANCYSFALDDLRGQRTNKAVPGDVAGLRAIQNRATWQRCGLVEQLVKSNPTIQNECSRNSYRVMLFLEKTNDPNIRTDFHWYREIRVAPWLQRFARSERVPVDKQSEIKFDKRTFMNRVEALLDRAKSVAPKTGRQDDPIEFHGIKSYYRTLPKTTKVDPDDVPIWANKAGWSEILTILSDDGKLLLDPKEAERGYGKGYTYPLYCHTFCVARDKGRTKKP